MSGEPSASELRMVLPRWRLVEVRADRARWLRPTLRARARARVQGRGAVLELPGFQGVAPLASTEERRGKAAP